MTAPTEAIKILLEQTETRPSRKPFLKARRDPLNGLMCDYDEGLVTEEEYERKMAELELMDR